MHLVFIRGLGVVERVFVRYRKEVLMVCYPYTAHGRTVHLSHSLLASRAPSISITLNALPITMVATEKPRSPASRFFTRLQHLFRTLL